MNRSSQLLISLLLPLTLAACSDKDTAQSHLDKAKSYIVNNKISESIIELKNAAVIEPKNAEVRFFLGKLYLTQGRAFNAVKELEKAKEFKYQNDKLIPLLSRAYLLADLNEEVINLSDDLAGVTNEELNRYLSYKTLASIRTEQIELAKKSVEQAIELSASSASTMLASAYVDFTEQKVERANSSIERVLFVEGKNPEALMLQGKIATFLGEFERATQSYLEYAKLQPHSGIINLLLADVLLKAREFDKAEKHVDIILQKIPNQPFAHYVKAIVLFEKNEYENASEHAEKALSANFNQPYLKLVAGASAYFLNNFEKAHYHLNVIAKKLPVEHAARKMLAISQLQLGLVSEIGETLNDFNANSEADNKFLSTLSFSLFKVGAISEAKALFEQTSTEIEDNNAEQNIRQAIFKLMLNDPSGIQNYKDAIASKPELKESELALAFLEIQSGNYEQAREIAVKWQEESPDRAESDNIFAAIYLKQDNTLKAKAALEASLSKSPNNFYALTELIILNFKDGKTDEAKNLAEQANNAYPNNPKILRLYYAINKNEVAFEKIKQAFENNKSIDAYVQLHAEVLIDLKKYKEAITVLNSRESTIKTSKRVWQLKLLTYKKIKDNAQIIQVLEQWHRINPYHVEPLILLADLKVRKGKINEAIKDLDKAISGQHSENILLKVVKIQLILDVGDLASAQKHIKDPQFSKINPVVFNGFKGRIALLNKDYRRSIQLLTPLYKSFSTTQNAILLSAAYQKNNQFAESEMLLVNHLKMVKNDNRVRMVLANYYLTNDHDKAIIEYQKLVNAKPDNLIALNNLAWLTLKKGNLELALLHAKKAYELAPEVADVADTYAQVLFKSGKIREALAKSKESYTLSKGENVDINLNYIEVLLINNRKNEAKKLLQKTVPVNSVQILKRDSLLKQE